MFHSEILGGLAAAFDRQQLLQLHQHLVYPCVSFTSFTSLYQLEAAATASVPTGCMRQLHTRCTLATQTPLSRTHRPLCLCLVSVSVSSHLERRTMNFSDLISHFSFLIARSLSHTHTHTSVVAAEKLRALSLSRVLARLRARALSLSPPCRLCGR